MRIERPKQSRGFTLIELLVVIALVAILSSLLLPSISSAKKKAMRIRCLSNVKQMSIGSQIYSQNDTFKAYTGTANAGDDDFNWLFPQYVKSMNLFLCPSTPQYSLRANHTREIASLINYPGYNISGASYLERVHGKKEVILDLQDNGRGKRRSFGHSYEVAGYMNLGGQKGSPKMMSPFRKTESTLSVYRHVYNGKFGLVGRMVGASDAWIFFDADDSINGSNNDYPDEVDNHGVDGGNVAFADGHAEWVPRRRYLYSFELGNDEPRRYPVK